MFLSACQLGVATDELRRGDAVDIEEHEDLCAAPTCARRSQVACSGQREWGGRVDVHHRAAVIVLDECADARIPHGDDHVLVWEMDAGPQSVSLTE